MSKRRPIKKAKTPNTLYKFEGESEEHYFKELKTYYFSLMSEDNRKKFENIEICKEPKCVIKDYRFKYELIDGDKIGSTHGESLSDYQKKFKYKKSQKINLYILFYNFETIIPALNGYKNRSDDFKKYSEDEISKNYLKGYQKGKFEISEKMFEKENIINLCRENYSFNYFFVNSNFYKNIGFCEDVEMLEFSSNKREKLMEEINSRYSYSDSVEGLMFEYFKED